MFLGALAFITSVAYLPGIPSAAVAPRWWAILIGAPLALAACQGIRITAGHLLGLAFLAIAALSFLWSVSPIDTANSLIFLLGLAAVFCAAAEAESLEPLWLALGAGAAVNAAVGFLGFLGVVTIPQSGIGALFYQQDFLGGFAALALIGLVFGVEDRIWLRGFLIAASAFAVLLSSSRGAGLAIAAALIAAALTRIRPDRRVYVISAFLILASAAIAIEFRLDHARQGAVTARLAEWDWVGHNLRWLGWGFGTLGSIFPFEHAENELLELAFDLGVLSIFFWALIIHALRGKSDASRFVLVAVLAESLTSFPLHNPGTAFVAAVCLGDLCGLRSDLRIRRRESATLHPFNPLARTYRGPGLNIP